MSACQRCHGDGFPECRCDRGDVTADPEADELARLRRENAELKAQNNEAFARRMLEEWTESPGDPMNALGRMYQALRADRDSLRAEVASLKLVIQNLESNCPPEHPCNACPRCVDAAKAEAAEAKRQRDAFLSTKGATSQGVLDMAIRAEREACAKVADALSVVRSSVVGLSVEDALHFARWDDAANGRAQAIAETIRARGLDV